MQFAVFVLLFLTGIEIYRRYIPIHGISAVSDNWMHEEAVLLDLRDYQTTYKCPICHSVNIPFAYLKRYHQEIPNNKKIIILASDTVEKNLAIRFLIRKNFAVQGYMIMNEKRGEKQWNMISKQKIV